MILTLGSTLLLLLGIFSYFAGDLVKTMDQSARHTRAKSHAMNIESAARIILSNPGNYTCSGSGGVTGCVLKGLGGSTPPPGSAMYALQQLTHPLDGTSCTAEDEPENDCQPKITSLPQVHLNEGDTHPRVTMTIQFPASTRIAPLNIVVRPNMELLQDLGRTCEGFFAGYHADGTMRCIPLNDTRAPPGQFISSVDLSKFEPKFSALPTKVEDCLNQGKIITGYSWQGKDKYVVSCGNRESPFVTR